MDEAVRTHPRAATRAAALPPAAICWIDPLASGPVSGWGQAFGRCASMGFGAVLVGPIFAPGADGDVRAVADHARLHPALGGDAVAEALPRLADAARQSGVALLLDLPVDRLALDYAKAAPAYAPLPGNADFADPRRDPRDHAARLFVPGGEEAAAAWWQEIVSGWARRGVAGLRLIGPRALTTAIAPEGLLVLTCDDEEARRIAAGSGAIWHVPEPPYGPRIAAGEPDPARRRAQAAHAIRHAAASGAGWIMTLGMEAGARDPADPKRWRTPEDDTHYDLRAEIARANAWLSSRSEAERAAIPRPVTAPDAPVAATLRTSTDAVWLVASNRSAGTARLAPPVVLGACDGTVSGFAAEDGRSLDADTPLDLDPGEVLVLSASRAAPKTVSMREPALAAAKAPRIAIENIAPCVDGGRFPVRRIVGERVAIEADVFTEGHDRIAVVLQFRAPGETQWADRRMLALGNDRWRAWLPLAAMGTHHARIVAWCDVYGSYVDELTKKRAAGRDVTLEIEEGRRLLAGRTARNGAARALRTLADRLVGAPAEEAASALLDPVTVAGMEATDPRPFETQSEPIPFEAERPKAGFAAWYEIFPRSMSGDPARHGTFDDVIGQLPRIRGMGFDVLYFPPIHPIGRTNRKGRNNTLTPAPDDPGSPYAIGSPEGGHDALHPELGSFDDFRRLIGAAAEEGLEIAIDFAIQCSPDHPWLRDHKDWFDWRPDGTIRYAENPPKRYEDIVNVDFYAPGAVPSLWEALRDVVMFWCGHGVRLFRVDNPHTKPLPFWEWMIAQVRARYPDAVFLSEAFTRPHMMYRLAKLGFSQSYTYFTWRNTRDELRAYFTELAVEAPRDFFRPHLFVNTPDINPVMLQTSGRPGFLIRAALAATLSGLWGVYCGFELCEGTPVPGKEEYLDSEKYQLRAWDWGRPGNIEAEIAVLNRIRQENPALRSHLTTTFHNVSGDHILWYEKATEDRSNVLLVAVSVDPHAPHEADVELPLWRWGLGDDAALDVEDLLTGARFAWRGKWQHIGLDPAAPYRIWRVRPAGGMA